jgi:hypothetical protein
MMMTMSVVRTVVPSVTTTRRVVGGAHVKMTMKTMMMMPLEARRRSVVVVKSSSSSFEEDRGGRPRNHRSSRTMDDDERTTRAVRRSKDRAASVSSSSGGKKSVKRGTRQRAALESALAKKSVSTLDEKELDVMTETMSFFAMVPLTLLTFPQIWKNYVNAMAGDLAVIGAVSWQGYGAGMLGNLLLLSYFADKREPAATAAQAIGVTTSMMLLTQIAWSGNMHNVAPITMFLSSSFVIAGTSLSVARYFDYAHGERGTKIWSAYQTTLGIVGILATPQIMSNALTPFMGWLPIELTILALVLAHRADALPKKWSEFSGWTATALFMSMPVAQIAQNIAHPDVLQGLSVLTSVFITSGNALMLSRAIFVRDWVWTVGSAWAAFVGGWGVLATLYTAFNPLSGERYLSEIDFIIISMLLIGYTVVVIGGQLTAMQNQSEAAAALASSRDEDVNQAEPKTAR